MGWNIEVYSWEKTCNRYLKEYAESNGKFIALDDYYYSVTFLKEDRYNPTGKKVRESSELIL